MPGPGAVPVRMAVKRERKLRQVISAGTSPQRPALRAGIILAAAAGDENARIARDLGCGETTVREWRNLTRKLLRRGGFESQEDLEDQITEFTTGYNETAHPWKRKYDADADHARYLQRHPDKNTLTEAA